MAMSFNPFKSNKDSDKKQETPLRDFFKNIFGAAKGLVNAVAEIGRASSNFIKAMFNLGRIIRDVISATYNYIKSEIKLYENENRKNPNKKPDPPKMVVNHSMPQKDTGVRVAISGKGMGHQQKNMSKNLKSFSELAKNPVNPVQPVLPNNNNNKPNMRA